MSKDPARLETLMKAAYKRINALEAELDALRRASHGPIAVIGVGCRFPGAENPEAFWQMLLRGDDAVTLPAPTRGSAAASNVSAGFLEQVDLFDSLFFRISPREALYIDPAQRLLLEVTWEALEHAGIPPHRLVNSPTGVFVGQMATAQPVDLQTAQALVPAPDDQAGQIYAMTGGLAGFAPGRLSYFLGVQGPSMAIDCSCSAALMSVHQAVNSLRRGECTLAIAGGVHLLPTPAMVAEWTSWPLFTAGGRCKTFDAAADGYGLGEGCGVVILKRLSDAQQEGDQILAVIHGSATNHDGPSSGLTVPNGRAQQAVIRQALADAGLPPDAIGYVEANGIGTLLGDAMEVEAIGNIFGERTQTLWLGAVAPNIGHLDAAAGMPALIKAVLAVQHGEIPPNLHFQTPSPLIDWASWPVRVPTTRTPWPDRPRLAGVSSFGLSGSNVHLVIGQAPAPADPVLAPASAPLERPLHLLTLSAKSESALHALAARYAEYARRHSDTALPDLCATANVGRSHFACRAAWIVAPGDDLPATMAAIAAGQRKPRLVVGKAPEVSPKIAFLCSGLGAQTLNMGRQLYDTQPLFRQVLERCDILLRPYLGESLLDILYPGRDCPGQDVAQTHSVGGRESSSHNQTTLHRSLYAETALFALEYALAQLWQAWGITPDVVVGHSVGEYVAACLAGVISLEDGIKLVAERARLIESASVNGATAAIFAERQQVEPLLVPYQDQVTLAGINSLQEILVAGDLAGVEAVLAAVKAAGLEGRRLEVAHAAHSSRMDAILDTFQQVAQTVTYHSPAMQVISSVHGGICRQFDAAYWRTHLRQPVRFDQAIQTLQSTDCTLLVELGPQPVLLWLGRQNWTGREVRWLASLRSVQTDWQQLLQSLSELYVQGAPVNWAGFEQGYHRRKVVLPTYPFQRQRHVWTREPAVQTGEERPKPIVQRLSPPPPADNMAGERPQSGGLMSLPGLGVAIDSFHLRQLPTTSDEWWYHAKHTGAEQWQVRILDGDGHCIAETQASALQQATAGELPVHSRVRRQTPPPSPFVVDPAKRERLLSGQARHLLPNQLQIAHLNPYETDYVYTEIFGDRCYMKHGITLQPGDTVIDIGANIGLFSLFVQQEAPGARIYAFEPSPTAFRALHCNADLYLPNAKVFNCGIADAAQSATFTFYQNSSVFSGFHAEAEADHTAIRTVVENMVRKGQKSTLDPADLAAIVDELMVGRMASQTLTCQLYALADILQMEQIAQIDLLKIDAEKSETAILRGLRAEDWPKIKQIVIEVHEQGAPHARPILEEVMALLDQHGFTCAVEEETFLHNSGLYNVFATRLPTAGVLRQQMAAPLSIGQQLQQARPAAQPALLAAYLRTVVAQIARIEPAQIAVDTPLIALGVDSLLAIEIRNQIKQAMTLTLPIATVLEHSITALAHWILQQREQPAVPPASLLVTGDPTPEVTAVAVPVAAAQPVSFQEVEGEL